MSVYENVAFPLRLRKLPKSEIDQRTRDALIATNLLKSAEDSPANLSGGGKQRVALARALAINPDVMLLDEPLSSLDPHLREEMRFEIKDLQRKYGFSIIYVTHDQSEAMALSNRILVMKLGVMQQIDTPLNVYNNPSNKFVFSFIGVSSFTDVTWQGNQAFIKGSQHALPSALIIQTVCVAKLSSTSPAVRQKFALPAKPIPTAYVVQLSARPFLVKSSIIW